MIQTAATAEAELGVVCAELGLRPSPVQAQALLKYLRLLEQWNRTYNLTAVRDPAAMLTQHLADCLAVVLPLQRHGTHLGSGAGASPLGEARRLLDVGSGGGLPAVVLATMLPDWSVTSVDAVGKKAAFVRQVAGSLPLPNLHAEHARVETFRAPAFGVITSRAFASLFDFARLTAQHLAPHGVWVAMKGRVPDDEIAALPDRVEVFHVEHLTVPGLTAARCLVWMRKSAESAGSAGFSS